MNRCFLMLGVIFLFLGACAEPDDSLESSEEKTELPKENGHLHLEKLNGSVSSNSSFQECRQNLINVIWSCSKGRTNIQEHYTLNQRPSTVDDEGTLEERIRVCELHGSIEPNILPKKLLFYAHYQKYFCLEQLNRIIKMRRAQGFVCNAGHKSVDDTIEDTACE